MKTSVLIAVTLLLGLASAPLAAQAAGPTGPTLAGRGLTSAPLASLPAAVKAAPEEIEAIAQYNAIDASMAKNGFARKLSLAREVRLSVADLSRPTPFALAGGTVTRSPHGDLVWTGEILVTDAFGLRFHLDSVALPPGSRAWTYGEAGKPVEVSRRLLAKGGALWAGVTDGSRAWLELDVPAAALGPGTEARFALDRVLEIVELDGRGQPVAGSATPKVEACLVDATCAQADFPNEITNYRRAVAVITFVTDEGGFLCSGALLADADTLQPSQRAFFQTARHCVSNETVAETVTAIFNYQTKTCDGEVGTTDSVSGAKFLATVEESDSTLIELDGLPPNPYFLPWNPDPDSIVDEDILHDLSHPHGKPQVFTRVRAVPDCVHNDGFFSTKSVLGAVAPGSSGSVLVNAHGEAVAQLGGSCAYVAIDDACDPNAYFYFGRFSRAYSAFAPFLEEPPPPPENEYFTDPEYPDWKFRVVISGGAQPILGTHEDTCLPETVCVSGAIAGRSEVFIRVVGPKPNGKLWPTLVKFTTSQVDVWIRQLSSGDEKHYTLAGASQGVDELPGLFDRMGFDP